MKKKKMSKAQLLDTAREKESGNKLRDKGFNRDAPRKKIPHSRVITIQQRIEDTFGHATGFDYLRVILAVSIVFYHSAVTSYGFDVAITMTNSMVARPLIAILLPMFFSLSGFLVAGSLERSKTLFMFMGLRVIRIFPALCVEIFLSALVLGTSLTLMPLQDYFSNEMFLQYFLNCIGDIHYVLPGVFSANPFPSIVNAQLWTVPWELKCYITIALLTIVGAVRHRLMLLVSIICLIGGAVVYYSMTYPDSFGAPKGAVAGWVLVVSFLLGVAIYLYSEKIIWDGRYALLACFVSLVLFSVRYGDVLVAIPVAYVTVYAGLLNPDKFSILKGADYSYGIFLYGFPIQQAFASLGSWTHYWWLNILVCVPLACVVAAFSWNFVEKPALALRKKLVALEPFCIRACSRYCSWLWLPSWLHTSSSSGLASPEYRK